MENKEILYIDEEYKTPSKEELNEFQNILKEFETCYVENQEKPVEDWLAPKLQEQLPEKSPAEIQKMTEEIISSLEMTEENKNSLEKSISKGRSKESWFASKAQEAVSAMSTRESVKYLEELDSALKEANQALHRTITTKAGNISQNPSLDGFIAEQYHVQTFNMNAEASGSQYRAKVLEPDGTGYSKNSVDIVIVDSDGKVVKRYQSKYCKDAKATEKAFEKGDYRGQQKLVPEGQQEDISKKSTEVLVAPDGTTSNKLSKSRAEQMRDEAQSGNWNDLNWNEYALKDLAKGVGKQAGYAAIQGAVIGSGIEIVQKLYNGEEIEADAVIQKAIESGADFGVKAAAAGALKVGAEKEIIKIIPKGTPASTFANIAHVAIENIKIFGKVATGELSVHEGIEKMEETTMSTVAGLIAMAKGTAVGTAVGTIFGPIGSVVGGFVGGSVGYMTGSKAGENMVKGYRKVQKKGKEIIEKVSAYITETGDNVKNTIMNLKDRFFGVFA